MPDLSVGMFVLYLILCLVAGLVGGFFGARAIIKREMATDDPGDVPSNGARAFRSADSGCDEQHEEEPISPAFFAKSSPRETEGFLLGKLGRWSPEDIFHYNFVDFLSYKIFVN